MNPSINLLKLDEYQLKQHIDLETSDECWYWRSYTVGKDYKYSDTNQLTINFKIKPTEEHRLKYKKKAIQQIAEEFQHVIRPHICKNYTFIPIPPSKPKNHDDYDDRLEKVLTQVSQLTNIHMDIRPCVEQIKATQPAHLSTTDERKTINELRSIYHIDKSSLQGLPQPQKIIIFDDVLTKGSHFKAVQSMLTEYFGGIPIRGIFISRSINEILTPFKSHACKEL